MWSNPVVRKFPWYGVFIATPAVMLLLVGCARIGAGFAVGVIVPSEVELVVYEDKAGYHGCGLNMDANEALQLYQRLGLALATIKQAQSKLVILPSKEIIAGANGG